MLKNIYLYSFLESYGICSMVESSLSYRDDRCLLSHFDILNDVILLIIPSDVQTRLITLSDVQNILILIQNENGLKEKYITNYYDH